MTANRHHLNSNISYPLPFLIMYEYLVCLPYILQGFVQLLPNGDRDPELRYFQYRLQSGSEGAFQSPLQYYYYSLAIIIYCSCKYIVCISSSQGTNW